MGDEQHRGLGSGQSILQPLLRGDVEEVVGLVEEQHRRLGLEDRVEHEPLALTARHRADQPVTDLGQAGAEHPPTHLVPHRLELVATERSPPLQRVADLEGRRVVTGGESGLDVGKGFTGGAHVGRGRTRQHQADRHVGRADAEILRQVVHLARHGDLTVERRQFLGDEAHERRLADAVASHQRAHRAGRHLERHVVEQHRPTGMGVRQVFDAQTHGGRGYGTATGPPTPISAGRTGGRPVSARWWRANGGRSDAPPGSLPNRPRCRTSPVGAGGSARRGG